MERGQLRLFPSPRPLVERLGDTFFREVPRKPGVYRMYDAGGVLLYVGKARDLRDRVGSYRRTTGQSRKTVRLIHLVNRIEWDVCETETGALLRENDLIRTFRPRFNRAGVWPRSARYVRVGVWSQGFGLELSADANGAGEGSMAGRSGDEAVVFRDVFGPFRGGPSWVLVSLGRLLWWAWTSGNSVTALPRRLAANDALGSMALEHPSATEWVGDLRCFFEGTNDSLVGRLVGSIPAPEGRFDIEYLAVQFEIVQGFYRRGPRRLARLRERFGAGAGPMPPEQVDDWSIVAGPDQVVAGFRPGQP